MSTSRPSVSLPIGGPLREARFLERPKRFLVQARLGNGRRVDLERITIDRTVPVDLPRLRAGPHTGADLTTLARTRQCD
jgi:hypothetical protein